MSFKCTFLEQQNCFLNDWTKNKDISTVFKLVNILALPKRTRNLLIKTQNSYIFCDSHRNLRFSFSLQSVVVSFLISSSFWDVHTCWRRLADVIEKPETTLRIFDGWFFVTFLQHFPKLQLLQNGRKPREMYTKRAFCETSVMQFVVFSPVRIHSVTSSNMIAMD